MRARRKSLAALLDRVTINGYRWIVKASELRAVAEEAGLRLRRGVSPHSDCSRFKDFAYAPPSGEGDQNGTLQNILKDLDLKMWRGNREGRQWKITKDCSNPTGRLAATP
jgi:hypothetical protein